ncbi:MAG TPA: hypothetical protein ENN80_05750 [Candidatus Hydrogenedentes bacterium]|nr:hypothetical protein [Candidatus Hydrogenedentota bacterium]
MHSHRLLTLILIMAVALGVATASIAEPAALRAGTAKTVITPTDATERVSVMGVKPENGLEHDLYARALTLFDGKTRLVIVTYDLNCLDVATPLLRVRCRDQLELPAENLILLGTHNHQAPIQIVPDNFDYGRDLADRIFILVQQAIANEEGPVRLEFGCGEGDFVIAMGSKEKDIEVQVLRVMLGDTTKAVLFNHPAHPLQTGTDTTSVGHCGYAVDDIEHRIPGALALYASAAGGNQFAKKPRDIKDRSQAVQALGTTLADVVMGVLDGAMEDATGVLSSRLEIISLPLAPPITLEEARALAAKKEVPLDIGRVPYPHPDRETNWIRVLLEYYEGGRDFPKHTADLICTDDAFLLERLPEPREFPCVYEETIVARLGKLALVAMQGEVCAPIGLRIKEAFGKEQPLMLFAYMGEHNLYIPTREIVEHDLYQAQVLRTQYACPVGWAPEVEDEMIQAVVRMIRTSLGE